MFAYLITSAKYYGNLSECDLRILGEKIKKAKARACDIGVELRFATFRYENSSGCGGLDSAVLESGGGGLDSSGGLDSGGGLESCGLDSGWGLDSGVGGLDSKEYRAVRYFYETCLDLGISPLLNLSFKPLEILESLAREGVRFGIHLKDSNLDLVKTARAMTQGAVFYSAHSVERAWAALKCGADFITLSPIFYDKHHKALGVEFLQNLDSTLKPHVFALGGINTDSRILSVKNSGVVGFAGIGYFL